MDTVAGPIRVYDLDFISKQHSASRVPELVLSVPHAHYDDFKKELRNIVSAYVDPATRYLRVDTPPTFMCGERLQFGYRGCAESLEGELEHRIHFPLYDFSGSWLALTYEVVLRALNTVLAKCPAAPLLQDEQFLELMTLCVHVEHGHTLSGVIFPSMRKWLRQGNDTTPRSESFLAAAPKRHLGEPVNAAMKEAWEALAVPNVRKYGTQCKALGIADGRFFLSCDRDRCSVGIHPSEQASTGDSEPARFRSENVNTHVQQLTLVAGIAKLVSLVRTEVAAETEAFVP